MLSSILSHIFGSQNERLLKRLRPLVESISLLEPAMALLSNDALRAKTDQFRQELANGAVLESLLPEAFAVVREASKRTIGLRHFDVQIMGGIVLHQGKISEMKTGEGKTLVATLPVYLNALTGRGVHVVTVNDYLAKRDAVWMGPIYHFLGLTVGVIQQSKDIQERLPAYLYDPTITGRGDGMDALRRVSRPDAYRADITYVTNNEIGFDYLRDNMVIRKEERSLRYLPEPREIDGLTRRLPFAIVDEVDSILIDEARTPLIISGPAEESTEKYYLVNRIVPHLKGRFITEKEEIEAKYKGIDLGEGYDYIVDEKAHTVTLTEAGGTKCERLLGVKSLYDDIQGEWVHHVTQALRAHTLFKRDVDYVVKEGQVIIVDEFTGRLMPGRRWSEGLHQAVEAKEGLRIAEENQTLATITFQNFFRLYEKLGGMTGTALTEAAEFWEIYKLEVLEIPTNRPMIRGDGPDVIYRTEREKYEAITQAIEELWKQGRPILVGTRSIEKSEKLSALLRRKGVPHQVLNAKYHEREAQIIAQAGRKGTCTIATNMAGRGTDIVLGGSPADLEEAEGIKQLGGLHVLGTERHESRRIDNQLRGRCGRQGDPGSSRFYLSLEDELMRLFGSDRLSGLMQRLGMKEGEDIQHPWVTRAIENAQRKVEAMNFDIRKQLLEYDNVMNKQREVIYTLRNEILDGEAVTQQIKDMILEAIEEKVATAAAKKDHSEEWDVAGLLAWMRRTFDVSMPLAALDMPRFTTEELKGRFVQTADHAYQEREQQMGPEAFRHLERMILLQMIDLAWKEHLYDLDQLKKGIGLRAYGQKDPLVEYQHESFNLFTTMMRRIREQTVEYLFRVQVEPAALRPVLVATRAEKPDAMPAGVLALGTGRGPSTHSTGSGQAEFVPSRVEGLRAGSGHAGVTVPKKIGRNDPCPCGSGKKYKKCCGR